MDANSKISKDGGPLLIDITQYRRLLGRLQYLTITQPDITYFVNCLSQFLEKPCESHLQAVHCILQYLKGTTGQGLLFKASNTLHLKGYADADWGSCIDTRCFVTRICVFIGSSLVALKSKK